MTPSQEAARFEEFAQELSGSPAKKLEKYIESRTARKRGRPVTREAVVSRLQAAGYRVDA